jgi:hypothetical protein
MAVRIRNREPDDLTPQCDGCNRNLFREARLGPELHDAVWLKLADKHAALCGECMFERAAECGVTLTLADLRPCMFNVLHSPHSWYDLFLSRRSESEPTPANLSPDDLLDWQYLRKRMNDALQVREDRLRRAQGHKPSEA